jgi:hypothetical protein
VFNTLFKFLSGFFAAIERIASSRHSYFWLSLCVFLFEIIYLISGIHGKDFWEHAAVINALSENPVDPEHPIINADLPHAFFSPYSVFIGFIGHYTQLSPFVLLTAAGIINLVLLLIAIRFFINSLFETNQQKIAFYFILLQLFAWGPMAWRYSSFYHIKTLHFVLPYPSTFAFILSLFSIGLFIRRKQASGPLRYSITAICILVNTIVLLTHPTTAIFLFTFVAALVLVNKSDIKPLIHWGEMVLVILLPFLIAGFWYYYPFWDLILVQSKGSQFHADSLTFYKRLFIRLLPLWIGIPLLWQKNRVFPANAFVLSFMFLLAVYLYGYFTRQYGYGRLIFFLALILHLLIVNWFTNNTILLSHKKLIISSVFAFLVILFPIFHLSFDHEILLFNHNPQPYQELETIEKLTQDSSVFLTDMKTTLLLPSFGMKVTASVYPSYWINDNEQRKKDIETYFGNKISNKKRKDIIRKYKINYILVNKSLGLVSRESSQFSYGISSIAYSGNYFDLLRIKPKSMP